MTEQKEQKTALSIVKEQRDILAASLHDLHVLHQLALQELDTLRDRLAELMKNADPANP